jgi:hypothetical protein
LWRLGSIQGTYKHALVILTQEGEKMKLLQIIPKQKLSKSLKTALNEKERELRNRGTTFLKKGTGKWKHTKYYGWINWGESYGKIIVAEIQSKVPETEWQLTQAFVGYLDRHFSEMIESITISYR